MKTRKTYYIGKITHETQNETTIQSIELLGDVVARRPVTFASLEDATAVLSYLLSISNEFELFTIYSGAVSNV